MSDDTGEDAYNLENIMLNEKKSHTNHYILYDCIKCPEETNLCRKNVDSLLCHAGERMSEE